MIELAYILVNRWDTGLKWQKKATENSGIEPNRRIPAANSTRHRSRGSWRMSPPPKIKLSIGNRIN